MDKYEMLAEKINMLEFHQKLLLEVVDHPSKKFTRLIIESGLSESEVNHFYSICDKLSKKLEEQKAEGYVYFHPLFDELSISMPDKLDIGQTIKACLSQNLYKSLFQEFEKFIEPS
ncbi:DUF1878 family protein [Neobacillus sp. 114]|uniref:DUF1878 family protein n=1 Tax=Neobacillus sp. 114 TaxID=3048535 RepID=UPI001C22DFE8|nr:DUF1878 family protein [Neobacillus sp. 114]MBU8915658.1 YhaI family protein [Bacillus sp. FJAT-29953]